MALTDRESIQQLVAIYAKALDEKDYETVADCFALDATAQYGDFSALLRGREEITTHMQKALEPLRVTQHLFTNFIIENDAKIATMSCDVLAQHIAGDGDSEMFLGGGKYTVALKKGEDRWRFFELTARSVWSMGNRDVLPRTG